MRGPTHLNHLRAPPRWSSALVVGSLMLVDVARARAETRDPPGDSEPAGDPSGDVPAPSLPPEPPPGRGGGVGGEGTPSATSPGKPPAATALEASESSPQAIRRRAAPRWSHRKQLGLAVLLGDGYRGIYPYKDGLVCGDANGSDSARVCTSRAPTFIDIEPSFGILETLDVLVDLRLGLQADFTTTRSFSLMPGLRYWLDPRRRVKFFTTVQLAYELSDQHQVGVRNSDFGMRNSNGFMVEWMPNFAAYVQFGETIGVVRWLSFIVDGGVGVQARFQ